MGGAKKEWARYQEEKWAEIDDKLLCQTCLESGAEFDEYYAANSVHDTCDYCSKRRRVVEINDLLGFIASAIHSEYEDPVHHMPYSSEEGGYYGATVYETEELLDELIEFCNDGVREDIVSAFDSMASWCERDALWDKVSDHLRFSWSQFSHIVKHEKRYFFPRPKKERTKTIRARGPEGPGDILSYVIGESKRLGLISYVPDRAIIYRGRDFSPAALECVSVSEIGVPDEKISSKSPGRLNPAGIPIFYGAFGREHLDRELRIKGPYTVGVFRVERAIPVLDLTKIPSASIFIESNRDNREVLRFFNHFRNEIIHPVKYDGSEHVEYVPSQVFAEFIRHRCVHQQRRLLGIKYPSSFGGVANIALFIGNDQIRGRGSQCGKKSSVLRLIGVERSA